MAYAVTAKQAPAAQSVHPKLKLLKAIQPSERKWMTEGTKPESPLSAPASEQATGRTSGGTATVLQRIGAGDRGAVQECIDTYGGLIWSLARRLAPTANEAEDAVQEIFIELWKHAGRFNPAQASETTFVAMIARRRLIDRRRAAQRMPVTTDISPEMMEALPDPVHRLDQAIEANAEAALAVRAIRQLKPTQQMVLQMSVYQGLTHHEIAQTTGIPLGTVKTYVRRGLLHVRQVLGVRTLAVSEFSSEEVQA